MGSAVTAAPIVPRRRCLTTTALLVIVLLASDPGGEARAQDGPDSASAPRPRVEDGGQQRGNPDARVLVIEFADFGCGYCAGFAAETHPALDAEFVRTGLVRWRVVPVALGLSRNSDDAAAAALCASRQDAFWPMYDQLFAERSQWLTLRRPRPRFLAWARQLGLDAAQFGACLGDRDIRDSVRQATEAARKAGVRATPTFLIQGRRVEGAIPLPLFRKLLVEALDASRAR
jgi:protein-disulfide isomerase